MKIKIVEKTLVGKFGFLTLGDLIQSFKDGHIKEYKYNRGVDGPQKGRIRSIAENFKIELFGLIHICEVNPGEFVAIDGHTRTKGAILANDLKLLDSFTKRVNIPVVIAPKENFDIMYKGLNNTAAHGSKHYATNPDTSIGGLTATITDDKDLLNKYYQQLSQVSLLLAKDFDIDWNDISGDNFFKYSSAVNKVRLVNKSSEIEELELNPKHVKWVKKSIKNARSLNMLLEERAAGLKASNKDKAKLIRDFARTKSWFGGLVVAGLADESIDRLIFSDRNLDELADVIVKKINRISLQAENLGRHHDKFRGKMLEIHHIING